MRSTKLRLIETTDLHMQLSGYDYLQDKPNTDRGLARLAPKIMDLRNQGVASVLLDNGDFLQGTPLADTAMKDLQNGTPHPMIAALNRLKYDAIALGNHEFDYGLDLLALAINDCDMPVVSANVRTGPTTHLVSPWTIVDRSVTCNDGTQTTLRVGVIGFVTPQISDWNKHLLNEQIVTDDIVHAAKNHISAMRRAGADIVVGLCHSGLEAVAHTQGMENAAAPLAALLGVDVVLAGHTHNFFPGEMFAPSPVIDTKNWLVYGKPLVMAGYDGLALGVIDLDLEWRETGWGITASQTELIFAKDIPEDATHPQTKAILDSLKAAHHTTRQTMNAAVSHTDAPLNSHFTMVGVDPTMSLTSQAYQSHIRKLLTDKDVTGIPLIGSVSSFRAGGHGGPENFMSLPRGPIVSRDIGAIAPFNNPICAVLRRGWQVRLWLEYAAGYFLQVRPNGGAQPIICPRFPSYHFDWLVGLTYAFDLTQPAHFDEVGSLSDENAYRVTDLRHNGKLVEDDDLFIVATSVYRAHGGGGLNLIQPHDILATSTEGATDILANFLGNQSQATPAQEPVWRFSPIDGARGVFRTSPAAKHTAIPEGVKMLAETPDGFDAYDISF